MSKIRLRVEIQPAPEGVRRPTYENLLKKALALADAEKPPEEANKNGADSPTKDYQRLTQPSRYKEDEHDK